MVRRPFSLDMLRRPAVLELLLVAPAALLWLVGAVGWSGYARLSNELQAIAEVAAEAASHAPAGGREAAARASAVAALENAHLTLDSFEIVIDGADGPQTLQLAYDASRDSLFALNAVMPMPSPSIVRVAAVR